MVTENPFLKESPLPYQLPPFNRINDSDYRPAFEAGMEERLRATMLLGGVSVGWMFFADQVADRDKLRAAVLGIATDLSEDA